MDWNAAIENNRMALGRVLAALLAMAGIADPRSGARRTLPRNLHRAVLALLLPAEAAARRLVIVAARAIAAQPVPPRPARPPSAGSHGSRPLSLCLPLFDPPSRFGRRHRKAPACAPRISFPGLAEPSPLRLPPMPFDAVDATRLTLRLDALGRALDDLPRQARRFARWRDARGTFAHPRHDEAARAAGQGTASRRIRRVWPLRPGRPPGQPPARRHAPLHEVHAILAVVDELALWALEPPDTS